MSDPQVNSEGRTFAALDLPNGAISFDDWEKEFDHDEISPENHHQDFPPFQLTDPKMFDGNAIPHREWIVDDWIPRGCVTLLAGDGGLGKSLLALQLAAACTTGKQWLGMDVTSCKAIVVACEDDENELRRRQNAINNSLGIEFRDLGNLRWAPRVGMDNLVFIEQRGGFRMLPLFKTLKNAAVEFGPGLIVLDSLHDFFGGNENSRPQVRFFIQALANLAQEIDAAVILLAHPSLSGLSNGSGYSGSTAWNNSVRSRLYLTRCQNKDGEDAGEFRELKTMKANYASRGGILRMKYESGVFVRDDDLCGTKTPASVVERIDFDGKALEEMRRMIEEGAELASDPNAKTAFVNTIRKRQNFRQISQQAMIACQARLLETRKVELVTMGPESRRRVYIRPADTTYAREKFDQKGTKK